jgi:Fe-S-cluster containining protein
MEKRFQCRRCGACCRGLLPLTWKDAVAHGALFPLCFVWTPVRYGSRDYTLVGTLGITIKLAGKKELAVLVVPTAYLPPSFSCPALGDDNLCRIQSSKPSRCKTMPFYPYRQERYQAELLTPRRGWGCDTSALAPLVFREQKIVFRDDFDAERHDLLEQAPVMRRYAEYMVKYSPVLPDLLIKASGGAVATHVVSSLSSFLTATRYAGAGELAQLQAPLLKEYAARSAGNPQLREYHNNYSNWCQEMEYLAQSR